MFTEQGRRRWRRRRRRGRKGRKGAARRNDRTPTFTPIGSNPCFFLDELALNRLVVLALHLMFNFCTSQR